MKVLASTLLKMKSGESEIILGDQEAVSSMLFELGVNDLFTTSIGGLPSGKCRVTKNPAKRSGSFSALLTSMKDEPIKYAIKIESARSSVSRHNLVNGTAIKVRDAGNGMIELYKDIEDKESVSLDEYEEWVKGIEEEILTHVFIIQRLESKMLIVKSKISAPNDSCPSCKSSSTTVTGKDQLTCKECFYVFTVTQESEDSVMEVDFEDDEIIEDDADEVDNDEFNL